MNAQVDLSRLGIAAETVIRNAAPGELSAVAVRDDGGALADSGALAIRSGAKTGRSPQDKRLLVDPQLTGDVWWGPVNTPLPDDSYLANRSRAVEFLNRNRPLYVCDGFAGWDPRYRLKIRVVCSRPYHALFMHNLLIRPTADELAAFGEPDYTILNAGACAADPAVPGVTSTTSLNLDLQRREFVILGTEYAGEMKKGVFTIMHAVLPRQGVLSMHCSANAGADGDTALFFGLSGTGKTTLSADGQRRLIGDDEHGWSDRGVFNIEGGCYAKCIGLSEANEPQIHRAIRPGTVLENVVLDPTTRAVDFSSDAITENTRAAYPIEFVPQAMIPCVGEHPRHVIFLTCDAFGVLPPVSRLNPAQAMYHFISGYSAKVAGTEMGVRQPTPAFSACYSAAFLVWHPAVYAEMLAEKLRRHGARAWLVNTGWSGGRFGQGARIKLAQTRSIVNAILSGALNDAETETDPVFGLEIPRGCPGVPATLLAPWRTWAAAEEYGAAAHELARLFEKNFATFAAQAGSTIAAAGPRTNRGVTWNPAAGSHVAHGACASG